MYRADLHCTIDEPWTTVEAIRVGSFPDRADLPNAYVTIERDGEPFARLDAWRPHSGAFEQVAAWGRFVVLGWSDRVHLVDPITRAVTNIVCDGYFGHLYPVGDMMLIADASRLICLDEHATQIWVSDSLGIDGVVVDEIRDGIVVGIGEWDPPGGWRPFTLSLSTGKPATR